FRLVSIDIRGRTLGLSLRGDYAPSGLHLATVPLVPDVPLPLFAGRVRGRRRVMLIPDTGGCFSIIVPRREAGRLGMPVIQDTRGTEGQPWTRYGAALGGVTRLR